VDKMVLVAFEVKMGLLGKMIRQDTDNKGIVSSKEIASSKEIVPSKEIESSKGIVSSKEITNVQRGPFQAVQMKFGSLKWLVVKVVLLALVMMIALMMMIACHERKRVQ